MNDESAIRLLIEGKQACFRRLEFGNSFVSYDVVPPLFVAKCLESVVGRRSQYRLTGIHVLKPLRFSKVTLETARGERLGRILNDVAYVIEASANPPLQSDTRLKNSAFLGLAAMPATVRQLEMGEAIASEMTSSGTIELGWLPYKRRETDGLTTFCRLTMINGWIDLDRSAEELMLCE